MGDAPSSLVVVIPARNEERRLNACLVALRAAIQRLRLLDDVVPVRVVLVLDRCMDRTAAVAARWPSVNVVVTAHGRVGAARAAGVRHAMTTAGGTDGMWIANTDADSIVPADWLRTQLRSATSGADPVLGMVQPNPADLPAQLLLAWHERLHRRSPPRPRGEHGRARAHVPRGRWIPRRRRRRRRPTGRQHPPAGWPGGEHPSQSGIDQRQTVRAHHRRNGSLSP